MKIGQVIDVVKRSIPYGKWENTVDTLKSGNLNNVVTGIVSAFIASVSVIERAAKTGSNFIITHEPTFYNHVDDTAALQENEVYQYKKQLIEENNLSIWRFHDNWHLYIPDGISWGMAQQLNWIKFIDPINTQIYNIPEIELSELIAYLKQRLGIPRIRYAGALSMKCKRVGVLPGACGGDTQMKFIISGGADVFICGETAEWQTFEYIRDANAAGIKKAIIVLGHANSEESGMEYFANWLKPKLPDIPLEFISAGDPVSFI